MRALAFFPTLDQLNKNDIFVLMAAAHVEFIICNTENEVYEQMKNSKPEQVIFLTEADQIEALEKSCQFLEESLLIILTKSKIETLGNVIKRCPHIRSFVALSGPEQYACDVLTLIRKYTTKKIFGLELYLRHGAFINEEKIVSSEDKNNVITKVGTFVSSLGTFLEVNRFSVYGRRVRELIDELILNAVFSANPRMQHANRSHSFNLEEKEGIQVRWGFDGTIFAISITDPFGSLERETILQYLTRSVNLGQIETRSSGGMGFQIAFDKIHQLIVNVEEGVRTELICLMKFEKRLRDYDAKLKSFHYFNIHK